MIDLAEMKAVKVDPDARTVRAEGGVIWAELNAATGEHGLAVTGGAISTTGIAGLTLGGGLGWLMGKYGLAADNLIAVELVEADGSIAQVDAASDPDLFWALRGGGGNFGIATSLTYRLHPLSTVTGGLIAHPVTAARDLLRFYRDALADCPDDLTVFAGLVFAPDESGTKLAALILCHAGEPEEAERDVAPFKQWGSPVDVQVDRMPYPVMNGILDEGFPAGSLNYWLSSFTEGLSDAAIDVAVDQFESVPSPMSAILFEHFHGAVTRVGATETAVPHREAGWNLVTPFSLARPRRYGGEHGLDPRDARGHARTPDRSPLAELSGRRSGRRRGSRRVWSELGPVGHREASERPGQRVSPQPQHPAGLKAGRAATQLELGPAGDVRDEVLDRSRRASIVSKRISGSGLIACSVTLPPMRV